MEREVAGSCPDSYRIQISSALHGLFIDARTCCLSDLAFFHDRIRIRHGAFAARPANNAAAARYPAEHSGAEFSSGFFDCADRAFSEYEFRTGACLHPGNFYGAGVEYDVRILSCAPGNTDGDARCGGKLLPEQARNPAQARTPGQRHSADLEFDDVHGRRLVLP